MKKAIPFWCRWGWHDWLNISVMMFSRRRYDLRCCEDCGRYEYHADYPKRLQVRFWESGR